MVIRDVTGDLLKSNADALVNPVNTVGVAGKGLASQFRKAYPRNFAIYVKACKDREIVPGRMYVCRTGSLSPYCIINFPTKRDWRDPSRLDDIVSGLADLALTIQILNIMSIAVPRLGCGLGGLDWDIVRPLIVDALGTLDADVFLYGAGP